MDKDKTDLYARFGHFVISLSRLLPPEGSLELRRHVSSEEEDEDHHRVVEFTYKGHDGRTSRLYASLDDDFLDVMNAFDNWG